MKEPSAEPQTGLQVGQNQIANPARMPEWVGRLISVNSESAAIATIASILTELFAAKRVCHVPIIGGKPGRAVCFPETAETDPRMAQRMSSLRESYQWHGTECLILRIGPVEEPLGVLEIFGTASAEPEQCLEPALALTGVCALVIQNARAAGRLQNLDRERDSLAAELTSKNRELESIIYAASHDLRSPLVNIQGFAKRLETAWDQLGQLLQQPGTPTALQEQAARIIEGTVPKALWFINTSVIKIDGLISGLLALSRVGRLALHHERVDMSELLRLCVATMQFQIEKSGVVLDVKSPLPPCVGDPTLLSQVFSNLLDNAIKYRAPERAPKIVVSGWAEDSQAVYCVADNGCGIPPEHKDRIWELFHRINPTGAAGDGLGLNLVRRIVERHQGRAWMESTVGEGSRFFVSLPMPPGKALPK